MKILHYSTIDSTNDEAKRIIDQENPVRPFALVADTQSKGYGRNQRQWESPHGGLWFTIVYPNAVYSPSLTLVAGIVVHKVLSSYYPEVLLEIKWPNDVYCNEKKLVGILCAQHHAATLVGIGINVNQSVLPSIVSSIATSLAIETARTFELSRLLNEIVTQFNQAISLFQAEHFLPFLDYYRAHDYLAGRYLCVHQGAHCYYGYGKGVSDNGMLQLQTPDGIKKCIAVDKIDILNN